MFKRILKILSRRTANPSSPLIVQAKEHGINKRHLSRNAIKVAQSLQGAGYSAYIVGGGVRDTLLGEKPKDFDIATNATPEQVRAVFRNSTIIGRRFRIVHVRFGREIIEVTTFRAHHDEAQNSRQAEQSNQGLLLRDNVYGNIQTDAIRRDFTVNALYYDPESEELFDFTDGLEDLQNRQLRIIGDPEARYREDPVRMLRAVRFAAKLGFTIEAKTANPIAEMAPLLDHIPSARLFEEVLKLMMSGSAIATLKQLQDHNLFSQLFPATALCLAMNNTFDNALVEQACINTDKRIRQQKRVTPAFIYAVFLWIPLQNMIKQIMKEEKLSQADAYQAASQRVISGQLQRTAIPKRFLIPMREIWSLQHRFSKRERKRVYSLAEHPRFRAAYDFLLLREEAGEDMGGLGQWWTTFQEVDDDAKSEMISEVAKSNPSGSRRRPRRNNKKRNDATKPAQPDNNE